MYMFYFFIVVRLEGVEVVQTNMKNVVFLTVYETAPTMNASPKMFVGAATQRMHALQHTGHMNVRLTAPHSDCGVESLLRETQMDVDHLDLEQALDL